MIPKIIHACWFGGKQIPDEWQYYINGWKKLNPDWEIKIWTEKEFEPYFGDSLFVKDCIANKKYGFLADYFRLIVLYEFGGVYLDTDVELLKPLDSFLNSKIFMCYIFDCLVGTATIGAEPHNEIIKLWLDKLLDDYDKNRKLVVSNNWITQYFLDNFDDFKLNGKEQRLKCGIDIYPRDYFEKIKMSKMSGGGYAIHHCGGSWQSKGRPWYIRLAKKCMPKRLVAYFSHKKCLKKNYYYKRYLIDKKK